MSSVSTYGFYQFEGFRQEEFLFENHPAVIVFPEICREDRCAVFKMEYFGAFPATEVLLLKRGYHLLFITNDHRWGGTEDLERKFRFFSFAAERYHLKKSCIAFGQSCGGLFAIKFASLYPEKVAALYLDAPVLNYMSCPCGFGIAASRPENPRPEEILSALHLSMSELISCRDMPLDHLPNLIRHRIPAALVAGDSDGTVPYIENGIYLERAYREAGIPLFCKVKKGCDHHPHGLEDPSPVVEFLENYTRDPAEPLPYLVLSDMDDTLLTHDKHITSQTAAYLHRFIGAGNIFAICSGRPKSGVLPYYEELTKPLTENEIPISLPMVTDNGCAIYNVKGKDIFFEIPYDVFHSFLSSIEGTDHFLYMTTRDSIAYAHHLSEVPFWLRHDKDVIEVSSLSDIPSAPLICNLHVRESCLPQVENQLQRYKNDILCINWGLFEGVCHLELHSPLASKGHALVVLREAYAIASDHTLAFGDALNDLSMIEAAGLGCAMASAVPELHEKADYVTRYDYDHDGVMEALKEITQIQ